MSTSRSKMSNTHMDQKGIVEEVAVEMEGVKKTDTSPTDEDMSADGKLDEEDVDKHLPIDRGWAWVILLGSSIAMFIVIGPFKAFGVFFINFQHRFQTNSAETSFVFTLQNITFSFGALLVMTLGGRIRTRTLVAIGSLIMTTVYILTGFVPKIVWLYIVHGVGVGTGCSFINPTLIVQLNTYFRKYRGLANNMLSMGISIGGLVMTPFFAWLFESYGYTGTMLITAGLFLNILVVALLMRDMDTYNWGTRKHNKDADECVQSETLLDTSKECPDSNGDIKLAESAIKSNVLKHSLYKNGEIRRKRNCVSESESEEVGAKNKFVFSSVDGLGLNTPRGNIVQCNQVYNSCIDIAGISLVALDKVPSKTTDQGKSLSRVLKDTLNLKIMCNPVFLYFLACNAFLCAGNVLVASFIIPHAVDFGVQPADAAWFISGQCIADIITRLPCGYLADSNIINRSTIVAGSSGIIGTASLLMFFVTSYPIAMTYSVLVGVLQNAYFCLIPVVILDILPMGDFKTAMGFTSLIQGLSVTLALPIAGTLRDMTGGYFATYYFLGASMWVGSVLIFFLPRVNRWRNTSTT